MKRFFFLRMAFLTLMLLAASAWLGCASWPRLANVTAVHAVPVQVNARGVHITDPGRPIPPEAALEDLVLAGILDPLLNKKVRGLLTPADMSALLRHQMDVQLLPHFPLVPDDKPATAELWVWVDSYGIDGLNAELVCSVSGRLVDRKDQSEIWRGRHEAHLYLGGRTNLTRGGGGVMVVPYLLKLDAAELKNILEDATIRAAAGLGQELLTDYQAVHGYQVVTE